MSKRKLKLFVMPVIYGMMFSSLILSLLVLRNTEVKKVASNVDNNTYVNESIISKTEPTISSEDDSATIGKPYSSDKVVVYKKYYDKTSSEADRTNSILFYNNTYVQNTGILYKSDETFDVICILNGTVLDVKQDETLGNVVEIKHENNIISTYEGLSEVKVKKNQTINQGDIIGKSGTIKIDNNIENSLLFELIYNGKLVNPNDYINKKINEL